MAIKGSTNNFQQRAGKIKFMMIFKAI